MTDSPKQFKRPPKRFQPKGMTILYEDQDILVVDKISGLLTVSTKQVRDNTAYFILTNYVRKGNHKSRNRVFIVHRLDKETSGVLVFARTEKAKRFLQDNWQEFTKSYQAIVKGAMPASEGVLSSYLAENDKFRVYSVKDPKLGKLAKTGYKVLAQSPNYSLLEINLLTGRKNQIRVHLADAGCPVVGDDKYGTKVKGDGRLALHAASLSIRHPFSKEKMTFTAPAPHYFNSLMKGTRKTKG